MNKLTITLPVAAKPRLEGVYPTNIGSTEKWNCPPMEGFSAFTIPQGWGSQMCTPAMAKVMAHCGPYHDKRLHVVLEDAQETPWFPHTEKPNFPGVYKTQLLNAAGDLVNEGYAYWDGKQWGNNRSSVEDAIDNGGFGIQNKPWKGLYDATKYEVNK